ncbi:MAG: carboxylate--amine ligase, partial [Bacilli bacterium]|nr:carboxylate--amine ligase [Bacilli bacterium]
MEFDILILGSDANAYYMARCAYEAYHKKAFLIGKDRLAFTKYSNILEINYEPDLWIEKRFIDIVNDFAKKRENKKILAISTNETYAEFLLRNQEQLANNIVYASPDSKTLSTLVNKENFYKTYKNKGLEFPETFYFDCSKNTLLPSTLTFPIILKPANVVMYNHLSFEGKNKIYKIEGQIELEETIKRIIKAGYKDRLIIQEFIPGDDSNLFDAVVYVDRYGKVKIQSFAQIGLQERTKSMVGNAAVLINGFNTTDGNCTEMLHKIKKFMENIPYHGFAEFDLKYDKRTNSFKVLEINARQGRCSYYISALGANLVKTLVDDLIYQIDLEEKVLTEEILLSFVPKGIIKKYIT